MQKFIMAIDQGTTGNTVLLINQQGEIISRAYHNFHKSIHSLVGRT